MFTYVCFYNNHSFVTLQEGIVCLSGQVGKLISYIYFKRERNSVNINKASGHWPNEAT